MEALQAHGVRASRLIEGLAVVGAVAYIVMMGVAMYRTSYDVWGAFIVVPPMVGISIWALRSLFPRRDLFVIAVAGLLVKFAATPVRYWVVFEAYAGLGDASSYHQQGSLLARSVRSGQEPFLAVIPHEVGTAAIEQLTGLVYTVFGASQLAGFFWFSWLGFWGIVLFVKAATLAVPELDARRYALLCFLAPTLTFWPSSIGKEAFMIFALGTIAYGAARGFAERWDLTTIATIATGTVLASMVRPHQAAIWLAGIVLALVIAALQQRRPGHRRWLAIVLAGVTAAGLVAVGLVTLQYLSPGDEGNGITDRIGGIFDENTRRSTGGGSGFTPPSIASPLDWPMAIVKTLFRPGIWEARGLAQIVPAVEMTVLLLLAVVGWRRLANTPRMMGRYPYVTFAVLCVCGAGLAFSTFGNLAILVRQRSLAMPLLLVLWALPPRQRRGDVRPDTMVWRPALAPTSR